MFSRPTQFLLNTLIILVLLGYVLFPSVSSFLESISSPLGLTFFRYSLIFQSFGYFSAILNSLLLSLVTVVFGGLFGISLAYLFWKYHFPFKSTLFKLFLLPIGLPPLIGVFAFQFLYSESGILPRLLQVMFSLDSHPFVFDGFAAVLVIHVYSFFVHFFMFGYAGLSKIDISLIEAAMTFGSSRWRTFISIIFPFLRPMLLSASLIVFVLSIASFTAPLLFASKSNFLTVEIYNLKISGDFEMASTLTVVLVIISISLLWLFERYNPSAIALVQRGARQGISSKPISFFTLIYIYLSALFVVLPIATLLLMSFSLSPLSSKSIFPTEYGFENYIRVFGEPGFYEPFVNSLWMSLSSSALNLLFGLLAGVLIAQRKIFLRQSITLIFLLPLAIPATALGVNLISTFNQPSLLGFGQTLVGTSVIVPLAYFIRHLPYITRSVSSTLENFDNSLTEAASTLGSSPIQVLRRITFPMISISIASSFLFTFISAFGEFPCSILLYTPENMPISVAIFSSLRLGEFGVASAQGVLMLVFMIFVTSLLSVAFKNHHQEPLFGY